MGNTYPVTHLEWCAELLSAIKYEESMSKTRTRKGDVTKSERDGDRRRKVGDGDKNVKSRGGSVGCKIGRYGL